MSRFEVNLSDQKPAAAKPGVQDQPIFSASAAPVNSGTFRRYVKIFGILAAVVVLAGVVGGFIYWQYLKSSPQYALAMLVDASRRGDQKKIDELVDTDAIVADFLPQITDKAVELYGKGLPAETVREVARVVAPLMPAVRERARAELPGLIREKTEKFENVPYWAIAAGAGFYFDITREGDRAIVKSVRSDRPLEIALRRTQRGWHVVGVKDEVLAQRIAEKIGQEIIAAVKKRGTNQLDDAAKEIGINGLRDLLDQAKDILDK